MGRVVDEALGVPLHADDEVAVGSSIASTTWLGQLGALGVLVLMTVTSFAVVAFFRRRPTSRQSESWWARS